MSTAASRGVRWNHVPLVYSLLSEYPLQLPVGNILIDIQSIHGILQVDILNEVSYRQALRELLAELYSNIYFGYPIALSHWWKPYFILYNVSYTARPMMVLFQRRHQLPYSVQPSRARSIADQ